MDELYVAARRVLLDALEVLAGHLPSLVQVGAHAVYLQVGESDLAVAPSTTGADLALDPRTLADRPALSLVGFQQRTAHEVDRFGPDAGPDLVVNGHAEDTIAGHRPLASNHLGNYTLVRRASRLFQGSLDMYPDHPVSFPTPIRAKVVRVGNSVGVRLPASLHLALGTHVEVIVRAVNLWPEGYFDMEPVGDDFVVPEREGGAVQDKRIKRLLGPKGTF